MDKIQIEIDNYGNVYFIKGTKIFQANINHNNELYLDEGEYILLTDINDINNNNDNNDINNTNNNKKINDLILADNTTLKGKTITDILLNDTNIEENSINTFLKFYPEELQYIEYNNSDNENDTDIIDEDNINQFGQYNRPFIFSSTNNENNENIKIVNRQFGDVSALYDTYIYDTNNKLICFRPIGHHEIKYILEVDPDDNIKLCMDS
jgi:hypothetical protein